MTANSLTMEISGSEGEVWSPPPLYKYVSLSRALKILQSGEIRFTQPRFLNDPHELSVEVNPISLMQNYYESLLSQGREAETAADIAKRNIVGLVNDHVDWIVAEREKIGMLSLADSAENLLMWAHYGDEHRGAVLELDVDSLISERTDSRAVQALTEVKYSDIRVDYIAKKMPFWMTLMFKSSAWAYEREWRLFKSLSMLRQKTEDVFVADLLPIAIKRVIFGARAFGEDENAAIELIQESSSHNHIEIHKAMFSSNLVGLDIRTGAEFAGTIMHGVHHFGENWREYRQWVDFEKLEKAEQGAELRPFG